MSANSDMWVISGFVSIGRFSLRLHVTFLCFLTWIEVLCSLNIMYLLFSLVSSHTDSQLFCFLSPQDETAAR